MNAKEKEFRILLENLKSSDTIKKDKAWNTVNSVYGRVLKRFISQRVKNDDDKLEVFGDAWEKYYNEIENKLLISISITNDIIENNKSRNKIPDEIIDKLKILDGNKFKDSFEYLDECSRIIGEKNTNIYRHKLAKLVGTIHFKRSEDLRNYLLNIAQNKIRELYRKNKTSEYIDEIGYDDSSDDENGGQENNHTNNYIEGGIFEESVDNEFVDCLKEVIFKLNKICEKVIMAKYAYKISYEDIAEDLNLEYKTLKYNANNCRQKGSRCLKELRGLMDENCKNI